MHHVTALSDAGHTGGRHCLHSQTEHLRLRQGRGLRPVSAVPGVGGVALHQGEARPLEGGAGVPGVSQPRVRDLTVLHLVPSLHPKLGEVAQVLLSDGGQSPGPGSHLVLAQQLTG